MIFLIYPGIRIHQELMDTPAFRKLGTTNLKPLSLCSDQVYDSDQYWNCFARHMSIPVHHAISTCKMGSLADPDTVVDPQLRYFVYLWFYKVVSEKKLWTHWTKWNNWTEVKLHDRRMFLEVDNCLFRARNQTVSTSINMLHINKNHEIHSGVQCKIICININHIIRCC